MIRRRDQAECTFHGHTPCPHSCLIHSGQFYTFKCVWGGGEGSELFTRLTHNDNSGRLFFKIVLFGDERIIRASTEIPTTTVADGSKNQLPGKQPMLCLLKEWFHPV
jgi:hypothetical protein